MSERYEKLTRYCNFCGENLSKEHPIPEALVFIRRVIFYPEGKKECKDVEVSVSIGLRHWEGRNQAGPPDICPDCLKALTTKAAATVFAQDLIEKVVDKKITEAENRMKDEARQIARLHLEANFGPMLDAHMAHRRSRKKGVA